jgi:hypothetical protein
MRSVAPTGMTRLSFATAESAIVLLYSIDIFRRYSTLPIQFNFVSEKEWTGKILL